MEIAFTQMDRGRLSDIGHARAHRAPNSDGWAIYCSFGPSWVWNYVHQDWDICTSLEWNPEFHERPFEEAKAVLTVVRTKRQIEEDVKLARQPLRPGSAQ